MDRQEKALGIRKIIAERMSESWHTSPRVVYTLSVDMTAALDLAKKINTENSELGYKYTVTHLLVKVCADAMEEFPYINASYEDEIITLHEDVNIGVAVATENGLIVPNVKQVQRRDYIETGREAALLVNKAHKSKLTVDDITGGTFTITNLGMMGIETFSPIINQPELAILGVNKIIKTPVCQDDEIVVRPMMKLDLVADHRVIDGAYAAGYLSKIKSILTKNKVSQ